MTKGGRKTGQEKQEKEEKQAADNLEAMTGPMFSGVLVVSPFSFLLTFWPFVLVLLDGRELLNRHSRLGLRRI